MALILGVATAGAQSYFWTGKGISAAYFNAANWSTGVVPPSGSTLVFDADTATGPFGSSLTLTSNVTAAGFDVESGATTGDTIQINTSPTALFGITLGSAGILINQTLDIAGSAATFNVPLTLSASQTWKIADSKLVLNQGISEAAASTALTLKGTGSLNRVTLNSGASTYSGGTTVTGSGTIIVVGANSTGPAGSPTAGPLGTGTIALGPGTSLVSTDSASVTLGNNIVAGTGPGLNTVTIEGGSKGDLILKGTISDPLSGTGAVQAISSGAVEFDGNNTYSGGTTLESVTATVGDDHGLGTGPLDATIATLIFTSANPVLAIPTLRDSSLGFADNSSASIVDMTNDAAGSKNQITLGSNTTLDLQTDSPTAVYYGTIGEAPKSVGSVTFSSSSGGVLNLYGANGYSGITTISSKMLVIADNAQSFGISTIVLTGGGSGLAVAPGVTLNNNLGSFAPGATVSGYGTIAPTVLALVSVFDGGVITGGKGMIGGFPATSIPGTLTFGSNTDIVLGSQGVMQFSIMNAAGMAGIDYSTIAAPNSPVIVTALSAAPFKIQLVSVSPLTGQIGIANFNDALPYTWTLITGYSINNFSASSFTVDATTDFLNALGGGTFSVIQASDQINLRFTPVPEPATWALLATGLLTAGMAVRRRRR